MSHPLARLDSFTYDNLNKELELTETELKTAEALLKAYNDDFWQAGAGSLLPPASGANATHITAMFAKRFVFRNVIKECTGRVAGAFFGKAPNWKFRVGNKDVMRPKNNKGEVDASVKEIDDALADLWTRQNLADVMSKAFESRLAFGRGGIRVFLPTKFKKANTVKRTSEPDIEEIEDTAAPQVLFPDIPSAIRAMRVEFVSPRQGRLLDDEGEQFSIVAYAQRKDWQTKDSEGVLEFSFVDNQGMTFLGTLKERGGESSLAALGESGNLSDGMPLDECTTYNEFKGTPYITHGLYRNNQLLNLALTCAGFSLVDNGFGEMVLTNVDLETEKVPGPDGELVDVPKRIKRGGAVSNNFIGVETVDEATGSIQRATPGVTFRDPTPITAFKDGKDMAYAACLEEAGQLYALISGDATASGESRIQALADFILKIMKFKSEVDEQGSWLMTLIMLFGATLAGKKAPADRIMFDCRVHVANVSSSERDIIMKMRKDGVISRETERVLLGVDDPALEATLVLQEQQTPIKETTTEEFSERLDVGLKMLSVGIDLPTIQKYLGYTEAEITAMQELQAQREAEMLASIADASGETAGNSTPQDLAAANGA